MLLEKCSNELAKRIFTNSCSWYNNAKILERERERERERINKRKVLCCIKIWYFNVDNIVISTLVKTKTNSKYYIE